jgi:hypothetical protein
LERIENYDMMAAMINDMIYSPEQNALHAWEGFPCQEFQIPNLMENSTGKVLGIPQGITYPGQNLEGNVNGALGIPLRAAGAVAYN